jgi:hypothetical protein
VTLYVDGARAGEGRVDQTEPMIFSADETCDVGFEAGSPAARLVWACGVLALVPALRLLRLAKSIAGRPTLIPTFLASVPVVFLVYYAAALGEAAGYLFGLGEAEEKFVKWELNTARIA